ncbi:bZIP transcription factor [Acinetobacter oleivorans]|uniref:BZIP transcription factor n=1 Tax=Acinetobacter oleivorans TaxID=1148157 RepID=A0ABR9NFM3_9GAMM|nr:bZIP transcription factor [Acinetobacter oleivorans]MBE2163704.1 bZIP transcription factor [Acinetobacter oleivorans]
MKANKFIQIIFILSSILLMGCTKTVTQEEYDNMIYEKDQQIAELEEKVVQLQDHIVSLESKIEEVNNQFERLKYENWRDVVPEAESSLDDLNNEINNGEDYSSY